MRVLYCLNRSIYFEFVLFVVPQFVCRTVSRCSQMGGVAPPLELSPPLLRYPLLPAYLLPHLLLTLTAPGKSPLNVEYDTVKM